MRNLQHSLGFIKSNNNYNELTKNQKTNLEKLSNINKMDYLTIRLNYKYWSTERVDNEIKIALTK